jgi:hypothetical protein
LDDFTDHENYNGIVEFDDGRTLHVYGNWLHNQNLDHWKDWICDAGSTRLYIDKHLDVYNGRCQTLKLGSALTGFELVDHTRCPREVCVNCTDDLIVTKHHPDYIPNNKDLTQ